MRGPIRQHLQLRIDAAGNDGAVNLEIGSTGWRVVNNELSASQAPNTAKAGGIAGDGPDAFLYGNYIHDVYCGAPGSAPPWPYPMQNHGIYIDGGGVSPNHTGVGVYDIGYNYIHNVLGGYGVTIYNDENSAPTIDNVNIHHNLIDGTGKGGINIADGSGSGFVVYDNIVANTGYAGLRFNTVDLHGGKFYNNVFYHLNLNQDQAITAVDNDWSTPAGGWDVENNIFFPANSSNGGYLGGSVGVDPSMGAFARNLYFGGQGSVAGEDSFPILGTPGFLSLGSPVATGSFAESGLLSGWIAQLGSVSAARAAGSASAGVKAVVTTDFQGFPLQSQATFDIGSYQPVIQ